MVNWDAPADKGYYNGSEGVIRRYTVYWDTSSGVSKSSTSKTVQAPATSLEITGLTNGQEYYILVTATTDAGEGNEPQFPLSNTPVAAETPGAPTITSVNTDNKANFILEWTPPTDTGMNGDGTPGVITAYTVYYINEASWSSIGSSWGKANSEGSVSIDDESLTTWSLFEPYRANMKLFFKMSATNAFGEGELSDEVSATGATPDDAPPGAPTINSATAANEAWGITLAWTAPTNTGFSNGRPDTITSYTVYYANESTWTNGGHSWTKEAALIRGGFSIDANSRTATVPYVGSTGDKFSFRMTATNSFGESELSDGIYGTVAAPNDAPPGAPSITSATPGDGRGHT